MRGSFDLLSKAHDLTGNPARAPHSVCVMCTADHPDVKYKISSEECHTVDAEVPLKRVYIRYSKWAVKIIFPGNHDLSAKGSSGEQ